MTQEELLRWNERQMAAFAAARAERKEIRASYRVEAGWFSCSDGRVNESGVTAAPPGLYQCWKNIGGHFDLLGWPRFQNSVERWWEYAKNEKRKILFIIADHFSGSDDGRLGCKGHGFNTLNAQVASRGLLMQFNSIFGHDHDAYVMHVTIDTDTGAIIFRSQREGNSDLDMHVVDSRISSAELGERLRNMYGLMPEQIMEYVLHRIALTNLAYLEAARKIANKPLENDHQETILWVGQGSDWINVPNTALVIGPFDHALSRKVQTGMKILAGNLKRRAGEEGIVLAAAQYRPADNQVSYQLARAKALQVLRMVEMCDQSGGLCKSVQFLAGVVNVETRQLTILKAD